MDFETADRIRTQVIRAVTPCVIDDAPPDLKMFPNCSLKEMLDAMEVVAAEPPELTESGTALRTIVDPRMIAAVYALKHYGGPHQLCQALGY